MFFSILLAFDIILSIWIEILMDRSDTLKIENLERQINLFKNQPIYQTLFDKIPDLIIILNSDRDAVFINKAFYRVFSFLNSEDAIGKRPGEIFSCINSTKVPGGCGCASVCEYCGAYLSIVQALNGNDSTNECNILDNSNNSYSLRVKSSPTIIENEQFIIFTLIDISNEKRKEVLERVFFHDILNTATSITSISKLLEMDLPDEYSDYKKMLNDSSNRLIVEIVNQKQLLQAEQNKLKVEKTKLNSLQFAEVMIGTNSSYSFVKDSKINISKDFENFDFYSDSALIGRVISNLLKNALEAEYPSGTVTLGAKENSESYLLYVHNKKYMPKDVQALIFRKSFSTKGMGRGIGTYSIKLFTENYLDGKVWFESDEDRGTSFYIELPK